MSGKGTVLLLVLVGPGCDRRETPPVKTLSQVTLEFYNALESIGEKHEELYDTDVREALHRALSYYFVWGNDTSVMPVNYSMFSGEADELVSKAVRDFCVHANALAAAEKVAIGQDREDILQNPALATNGERSYDDFIGHAESVLPEERPNDHCYRPGECE
jgi:hypothetical protein